jgi:hypothetical protein
MRVTAKQVRRNPTNAKEVILWITTPDKKAAEEFMALKADEVEIKPKKKRRSLDANAYMWVLCDKIAKVAGTTKEAVYLDTIRDVGVFDYLMVSDKAVDTFIDKWKSNGIGWYAEKHHKAKVDNCTVVIAYYGSSTYDTKQMSRLVDMIVQMAKELGIETMTPAELSRIKEAWK